MSLDKKLARTYDNASTQINVPPEIAAEITRIGKELIPDEHLAGDGRPEVIHVTVKYGVKPDARALQQAIAGYKSFQVVLGKLVTFPEGDDKSSPVVIEVHGHEFEALHKAVAAAMGTLPDDFPYTPHITIAYVQPKEAQHYAGNESFVGTEFVAEAVTLSMFEDGNEIDVPLAKAAGQSALPPAPGTAPIPTGAVRFFHYTQPENAQSIKQQGLLKSKGRGDDSSFSGPSAGVWASTQVPNYNALRNHFYIEFWAMPEEISHNANYPHKGEDATAWGKSREQHAIMAGNIPPDHILAIHEPWQDWARYLEEGNHWEALKKNDPKLIQGCADGTMDKSVGFDCAEAVRWMLKTAAPRPRKEVPFKEEIAFIVSAYPVVYDDSPQGYTIQYPPFERDVKIFHSLQELRDEIKTVAARYEGKQDAIVTSGFVMMYGGNEPKIRGLKELWENPTLTKKAAAGMPPFQVWFKSIGGVQGFLADSDVSLIYEEDFREVADEDDSDAAFIAYITERMKEDYGTLARFFRKFKWPIPIYRAITVESVDHIDTTMAGVHWTWNADAPEAYWGEHNQGAVILKAFAKPSDIDWKTTITKNLHPSRGEDEAEITIKKGAKLQFAGYCSDKEYWGGNRKWTPLPGTKTVTAAQVAEIPEIAPQYQHEEEQPEEEEEVQRDEPATEQGEEQPKPQKRQPKNKLLQPKKLKEVKPKKPPVETTNFKKWFGKSQVRDESGKPLVVYHGTTHDFEAFDPNTGNPENHYGKALYFTSSKTDVSENYATEAGPDLTSRIDNRSERIMQEWEDQWDDVKDDLGLGDIEEFPSYSEVGYKRVQERAKQEAKKEVAGQSQGMTMPVYLSLQNPVVVQKRGGTQFQVIIDDDGNESGNGLDMYNAMHLVGGNFNADVQGMWSALFENTDGDFNAWDFEKVVRGRDDVEDDEGNLVPGNYIAQVYQEMGFDGIIQSAYEAFGPQSLGPGYGQTKGMTMDRDTKHYILWDPHKIKSAIGNKGKFDRKNPNITAAVKTWWHVSTVTNRASILANGLKVPKREDRQFYSKHTPGVYVFPSESEALNWTWNMWGSFRDSERGLDLWRVRIDDKLMKADNHPESEGAYYTTKSVPASNVKLESYLTEDGNQHDPSDEDGHFDEDDVVYLDDEKTAAVTKRVITVDELPAETQGDLACELSEHLNEMGVRLPHDPDRELDCDDVRQNLTGLVDPPNITVYDAPVAPLYKTMHRTFSGGANNAAVKKYMEMLKSGMEFDPIFVVNGKFHDGGHRMEAYYRAGRKTIPVAEIGPFLRAKPEFWKRWFADDPSAKFATMKIALNVPRLVKDFGQKFLARVQKDRSAPTAYHAPVETEEQVQQQATALINQIAQTDPSPNKEYTAWIVGNYARGGINRWEDIQARIVPALKKFDTLKLTKKLPVAERDIMKVKGIEGLEDLMEKYKEVEAVSEGQKERDVEQGFFKNGEAEIIHDDAQIKIIYPKSQKAACFFGINTRWCTAATEGRNYFDHYNKQGPLYIVLIKADNKRYQLHFQSESYMDEKDKAINPWDLTDSYPVLKKIFQPVVLGLMRNNANIRASFVAFVENPDTNMMLKAVDDDPSIIDHFPDAPEEVKWRAFCRRLGLPEENYDSQLQGFVVAEYKNVEDFAGDRGDDAAKWAAGITSGAETLDSDSSGYEASTVLEACADTTVAEINAYIKFHHEAELQEWMSENDEAFPLSLKAIEQFISENDPSDLDDKLRSGWYSGTEAGSQDEIIGAFKSAVLGLESGGTDYGTTIVLDREKFWDSPVKEILPLADAQTLVKDSPDGIDLWEDVDRNRDTEILHVRQPYYGFSGWSDEACNERVSEEFYISEKDKIEKAQKQPKKRKKPVASLLKKGVGEKSVGDLGLAKKIMHELMPVLGEQLPEPELKIVNAPRAGSLGSDMWPYGITNGKPHWGDNTTIEIQKSILNDENTLRRVLAHELCHHADNLVNGVEEIKKVNDLWTYKSFMREQKRKAHGTTWKQYTAKFNAKYGADFVTEKTDKSYATEVELRPYYILLKHDYDGKPAYEVSSRISPKMKRVLDRMANDKEGTEYRLTQTDDPDFYEGQLIGSWYWSRTKDPEKLAKLEELWNKGQKVLPTGAAKEQDEILQKMRQVPWLNKGRKSSLLNKKADVPQLQQLEHGVSKDYDRVRWVYQQFYDNGIQSMSWQDFQKKFPKERNSPLFTKVRQNRPKITLDDMDRWMEEYSAKAKEYQNYEIEHDTYQDEATSFRNVEQLVLKINQSASAREIIGEDPMLTEFLGQIAQGSAQSGHPAGENTVGWLRVDFIDDNWLLVDEVQSDLINAMELGKKFLAEPSLDSLMSKYKSETVKQKIRDMGVSEQSFQMSKREMLRRGYTPEKLDEMKQQLANLFKDWADYGIASLIEIARRHGIKNVAIHTGETIAKRDPDLEADKAGMYYDQLAKSFGFKQQQLDVGDLKGNFWVRTASAGNLTCPECGSTKWNKARDGKGTPLCAGCGFVDEDFKLKHAGKRSEAVTSMTVGTTDPNFPMPLLIRWEQGMRWRQVLKTVKAIVSEIAGHKVPWRDIHIWASLWGSQEAQQEGWEQEKVKSNRVMYDILHNGTYVRVDHKWTSPVALGATEKLADSHKITPLDDTYFDGGEIGQETNSYAEIPERMRGIYDVPPLKTLAPQMFTAGETLEGVEYRIDVLDSRGGELYCRAEAWLKGNTGRIGTVDFNEVEADIELDDTRYYKEVEDEFGAKEWERVAEIPKEIWIKYVWVEPKYRRHGIATGMYEKIKQEFPGEKITSSGTTPEGGKFREKLTERGVLAKSALLQKNAVYGEAQNQVQHTDHQTHGLTKTLKSDPFSEEMEALQKDNIEPNPILESGRTEGQPTAKGEDQLQMKTTKASVAKGQVYLLHFDASGEAHHHLGWSVNAQERIGLGTKMAQERKSTFTVARVWDGADRDFERKLQVRGKLARWCPICHSLKKSAGSPTENVEAAIAEIDATYPLNPLNQRENIVVVGGNLVAVVEVAERSGRLRLRGIRSLRSKEGAGSAALKAITAIADKHGVEVELTASPYGPEADRLDKDTLQAWYRKNKFEDEPGYDPSLGYMVRKPKSAAGSVDIDWKTGMFENYKLDVDYAWHEHGDPVDDNERIGEDNWNMLIVNAFDTTKKQAGMPGKWVGSAEFVLRHGQLESTNTDVSKDYWRQGIATAIYQYAEGFTGLKTVPHKTQSPAGRALWQQKDRPFGKNAGLRGTLEYHRSGKTLWIDMFALRPEDRGQGGGSIAWKEFESSIPQDIELIRLFAGDTGGGISTGFWEKMGFDYVYDQETGTEYDQYMWKGANGHPTPAPIQETPDEEHGYDIQDDPEKQASKTAVNRVSGEDVVTYVQKLNKWDRQTAYQTVGLDAGGDYVLRDYPVGRLVAGDDYDPELAEQYAKQKGEFPPIVLGLASRAHRDKPIMVNYYVIRDGNHRVAAAKLRGDSKIKAYVPLDSTKEKK